MPFDKKPSAAGPEEDMVALMGNDSAFDLTGESDDSLLGSTDLDGGIAALRGDLSIDDQGAAHERSRDETLRALWPLKVLYFLGGMSASTWGRFGTIYYNEHHLSPSQIGVIEGVMTLAQAVASPLWGLVADKTRDRKAVMLLTSIVGPSVLLLLAVPSVADSGFWGIFWVSVIMSCFACGPFLDAYTLDMLGEAHRDQYGKFSIWGSLSWGLGALLMGGLTDTFGFHANFIVLAILALAFTLIMAWYFPRRTAMELSVDSSNVRMGDLIKAFAKWRVLFFFIDIIAFGMGMAVVERLLFLYLLNDLKASTTLCGLTVGVTVLFELPIFHYSDRIMKVLSHDTMFMIAMFSYIVRVFGYTLLTPETVWFILPLELLHGITFAMMWSSGVAFMTQFAPSEWITTAQSILSTVYYCFGYGLGSFVGGYVMERYGARVLYGGAGFAVSALLIIHATVIGLVKLRSRWQTGKKTML